MPDLPISALPPSSALTGTEEIAIVQGGVTKRSSIAAIAALIAVGNKKVESFTIAGGTVNLTFAPIFVWGFFVEGQQWNVGGVGDRVTSVVGNVVTLDDPTAYIGLKFTAVYQY